MKHKSLLHPSLKMPVILTKASALCSCLPIVPVFIGNKDNTPCCLHVGMFWKSGHFQNTDKSRQEYQKKVDHRNLKIWAFVSNTEDLSKSSREWRWCWAKVQREIPNKFPLHTKTALVTRSCSRREGLGVASALGKGWGKGGGFVSQRLSLTASGFYF